MSSKFSCRFCKEQFDVPKGLYKHLQSTHSAGTSRDNRTCPICGVLCLKYEGYRDHLLYIHGQTDEGLKLTFKSLNEFLVWKAELELKHNCKYVLQSSPKVLPSKEKKYFYQCDSKSKKDKKSVSVVMKTCPSVISVVEGINVFKVEYWDSHLGHSESPPALSLQNELEVAINSVEMVNAIADNEDSNDRSETTLIAGNSSPSVSNVEKQSFFMKSNSPSNVYNLSNSLLRKKNNSKPSFKIDSSKKKNPNTILFSLASVACGKGIAKKTKAKDNLKTASENLENTIEQVNEGSFIISELPKSDSTSQVSVTGAPLKNSSVLSSTITSMSGVTKTVSSGLPAIAPKITSACTAISSASYTTINSLINSNSAFPNQLVIVNPVGMDQNSLNSKQNVLTGQNILFSLGSPGQNVVPAVSQSINAVSAGEQNVPVAISTKETKFDPSKITSPSTSFQNVSKSNVSSITSIASSTAPVTLKSGLNNAPVFLSSLPIGSTFMSVNNSLIPIATPSGTFLPTSLPPNVVLTPVISSTATLSSTNSTQKTTFSSVSNTVNTTKPSVQSQVRYTPSSSVAVTVSSIIKEPVYSSSTIKQVSHIAASSKMPISSSSSLKTYSKKQKTLPTTISGRISPIKNLTRFMSSTPLKSSSIKTENTLNQSEPEFSLTMNKIASTFISDNVPLNKKKSVISNSSILPAVTVSSIYSVKSQTSARKRISSVKSKSNKSSINNISRTSVVSSPGNTKVVNSQLNLAPISSTTIASQSMDVRNSGTLLFESAGDVYMLEPVENHAVSTKSMTDLETSKRKIDRSVQTVESIKPKIQRKRNAAINEDSAVMLKVKCYQLEMKYLNILGECKRLKVELTKERLKNAELAGEKPPIVTEEEMTPDTSRSKASEIMKDIEENYTEKSSVNIYTLTKTSVLRSLYEDFEDLCTENIELNKELENYRAHDKFYKSLKKKLYDEEF